MSLEREGWLPYDSYMIKKIFFLASLWAAIVCGLTSCQGVDDEIALQHAAAVRGQYRLGQLLFHPCTLVGEGSASNVQALCSSLEVAENPSGPEGGRRIRLKIGLLRPPEQSEAEADPVFFIAGGPGQAATAVAGIVNTALGAVRRQRNIILVDQRGTGGSHALHCPLTERRFGDTDDANAALEQVRAFAAACADEIRDSADVRFYTTTEAVSDLEAVRQALSAEKINLIGVSYGTRVAQHYASLYPGHTRAVVLDSVVPNDLVVGGEFSETFEQALILQSAVCQRDERCQKRFPADLRQQLRQVLERLSGQSLVVDYRDPGTGESRQGQLTSDTLVNMAFAFSYLPQTAALLPLAVDEAAQQKYSSLMAISELMNRQMQGQINRMMQWSVICTEDADRYQPSPASADTILGSKVAELYFAPCGVWPGGRRPDGFSAPFLSGLPVLLLSGEFDPVTPPAYAHRVLQGLPNGRHLLVYGLGHGTLVAGCMPKLLGQFFETADPREVESGCLRSIRVTPPFISFNGWAP